MYQIGLMMLDCDVVPDDGSAFDRLETRLRRFTAQLVRRHRNATDRIAYQSLASGHLAGAELDNVFKQSS
jgi:hypothetical protein